MSINERILRAFCSKRAIKYKEIISQYKYQNISQLVIQTKCVIKHSPVCSVVKQVIKIF